MTNDNGQYNPKNPDAFNQFELPPPPPTELNIQQISPGQSALLNGDFISPNYKKGRAGFKISSDGSIEANNLTLYSNQENAIIIDYGGNILMKEGGNINFTSVTAPDACVATLIAIGTGNIDNGTHKYKITFINDTGETELGTVSNTVTVDASNKQVALSDIPISTSLGVTSRKIYRTKSGGSDYYLLTTIYDNTTTSYIDDIADINLLGDIAQFKENDSFGKIKINGIESMSLGIKNTFIGQYAGLKTNVGYYNTAIGDFSMYDNIGGYQNTAIGYGSLSSNTEGDYNTAIGYYALKNNTSGFRNVAIGANALYNNTTNYQNVAIGDSSLFNNTTGYNNIGIGYQTIYSNQTGLKNVAIGTNALYSVTGSNNIGIGFYAGKYETGSDSFYVNNQDRTNTTGDKTKSLLYGIFASTAAAQKLTINALLNLSVSKTPSSASDTGVLGDIAWDTSYIYVCTATNTWKRVAIATW